LSTIHGGGNSLLSSTTDLYLQTSEEDADQPGEELIITRLDGRSYELLVDNPLNDDRFEVGQVVQLAGEAHTREVLAIRNVDPNAYQDLRGDGNTTLDDSMEIFLTAGMGSQIVLSSQLPSGGADMVYNNEISEGTLFVSQPTVTTETVDHVDINVDRLTRSDSTSWNVKFNIGDVVFIDGIAGGFTIADIVDEGDTSTMVLANAALDPFDEGAITVTVSTTDVTTTDLTTLTEGEQVGGDHFVVTGGAGPESPLVIYGDTSQDGVWYSGHPHDRLGLEFGDKPFDPFPHLTDEENEDDEWIFPLANPFTYHGNDVIDASQLFAAEADAGIIASLGITVGLTASVSTSTSLPVPCRLRPMTTAHCPAWTRRCGRPIAPLSRWPRPNSMILSRVTTSLSVTVAASSTAIRISFSAITARSSRTWSTRTSLIRSCP
jgi:hypothetical protein